MIPTLPQPRLFRAAACAALLAGLACAAPVSLASAAMPTVQAVRAEMDRSGGRAALEKYFACNQPKLAYDQVAQGSKPWVDVAADLLAYADPCEADNMASALGRAMLVAPATVLPLVGRSGQMAADRICLPFYPEDQTAPDQLAEVRKSRRAIEAVDDPQLANQKKACLGYVGPLEKALEDLIAKEKAAKDKAGKAGAPARGASKAGARK